MKKSIMLIFAFACLLGGLAACKDEIRIPNFEGEKWKADANGCKGDREKQLVFLMAAQNQLISRSEVEIKALLGKPDAHDLRPRGQKFFEYAIKGGVLCEPPAAGQPEILRIRFDALDRVSEVSVY